MFDPTCVPEEVVDGNEKNNPHPMYKVGKSLHHDFPLEKPDGWALVVYPKDP